MSPVPEKMLWAAGTLMLAAVVALVYLSLASEPSPLSFVGGRYAERLEARTRFLRHAWSGARIAQIQMVFLAVAAFSAVVFPSLPTVFVVVFVAVMPAWALRKLQRRRLRRLEGQLDSWLLMLSNALSASPSIGEAMASTTKLVPNPFREEVDLLVKEIRLGVAVDDAVRNMAKRIRSPSISAALITITVARQTGGSLTEILEYTASTLRESARLEGVLRTKTAEGRGQVIALAVMPFVLCSMIAWMDPSWFGPMREHATGQLVLLGCAVTWAVALIWARRIVDVEV